MSTTTNGYVLHETATAVSIATGFTRASGNRKTGEMVQIWFLAKSSDPVRAQMTGRDVHVCGDCPLRPALDGGCYVNIGRAPYAIWQAWHAGHYPALPSLELFRGRMVRFGAYGDPTLLPLPLLAKIAARASGWTGYTHQWRNPLFASYRAFLMASADDVESQIAARKVGWRTFRVAPVGSSWRMWQTKFPVPPVKRQVPKSSAPIAVCAPAPANPPSQSLSKNTKHPMIPHVKTWIVTLDNGTKTEVLAPTRRLALLNYRFDIGYAPIRTIGLKRSNPERKTA